MHRARSLGIRQGTSVRSPFFKTVAANLLLCAGSCAVVGMVLELWFRIAAPQIPILPQNMYSGHAQLRYVPTPQFAGRYRTTEFDTRITINTHGLRDYERPLEKPPGTFRILCLGDSFTLGSEVALDQSYPKVLERFLNQQTAEARQPVTYEVLNAGVGGYGTYQELLFLNEVGLTHRPDLILVQFYANDVSDNMHFQEFRTATGHDSITATRQLPDFPVTRHSSLVTQLHSAAMLDGLSTWLPAVKPWLSAHSHLYHFLRARGNILLSVLGIRQFAAFDDLMVMSAASSPDIEAGWALTKKLLLEMNRLAAEHHATLAVIVVPNKAQVSHNWRYDAWVKRHHLDLARPARILTAFGQEAHLPVFDLLPDLQAAAHEELYYRWDGHWNANGCRAAAQGIVRFLLARHLIPTAAS